MSFCIPQVNRDTLCTCCVLTFSCASSLFTSGNKAAISFCRRDNTPLCMAVLPLLNCMACWFCRINCWFCCNRLTSCRTFFSWRNKRNTTTAHDRRNTRGCVTKRKIVFIGLAFLKVINGDDDVPVHANKPQYGFCSG